MSNHRTPRLHLLLAACAAITALALTGACGDNIEVVSDGEDIESCPVQSDIACVYAGETNRLGFNGDGQHRLRSTLYWPVDISFGPDDTPYVLDWNNHAVRRILPDQTFETIIGNGFVGDGPPDLSDLTPQGAPGTDVALNHPTDLAFLDDGTVLLMAWHNHKIRTWDPETRRVHVMSGRGAGFAGDGGPAATALFNQPNALVTDADDAIYVLDQRNFRIRKILADAGRTMTTVAGTGVAGFAGDGGSPLDAQLQFEAGGNPEPSGALAFGPDGALYVADSLNHRIRRIDFAADTIETVVGIGTAGFSGDGGPATEAEINNPRDIEFGADGRLYVADTENHRIRVVDLETGVIDTFAGTGLQGDAGDGVTRDKVELDRPFGIGFDADGNLYIADMFNSRILKVAR